MTTAQQIVTIVVMALCVMLTRFVAFIAFPSEKHTPRFVKFLGKWLPGAVFGMLVVYCLKDTTVLFPWRWQAEGLDWRTMLAVAATVALHLWKKSFFATMAGGAAVYMVLVHL